MTQQEMEPNLLILELINNRKFSLKLIKGVYLPCDVGNKEAPRLSLLSCNLYNEHFGSGI